MIQLLERFLLFLCCGFFSIFHANTIPSVVLTMLVVIIASSLCGYYENRCFRIAVIISYTILAIFFPAFLFFIPLLVFDFFNRNIVTYQLFFLIPYLFHLDKVTSDWLLLFTYYFISLLFQKTNLSLTMHMQQLHSLQDETAEITDRLHKKNQELIETQNFEIKAATLDERNRIAREIHDSVGHQLSSAILQTGALLAITQEEQIKERLTNLKDTLTVSMDSIRHSIHNIHEESLDLEEKILGLIHAFTFCPVTLEYQVVHEFSMKVKYALIFIIKEGLSNIMRHSNATSALISIYEHPAFYQIRIRDNGTGKGSFSKMQLQSPEYPIAKNPLSEDGMGLIGISERVEALEGKLNIRCENGFELFITLPANNNDSVTK